MQVEILEKIEKAIKELDLQKQPYGLYEPISYTMQAKGKRIRPLLTLLVCKMFSDKIDDAILPAVGLEMFHNFTLLHDDIMDNAPVRRGNPTVHVKWNANTAILSGDTMLVEAYKLIAHTPIGHLPQVLDVFSKTAAEVCEGQMYDMEFEERNDVSEEEYIEMIRLKTSVLLAGALKIGAIIGGASDKDAELMYDFGINLGLAFQLKDDWLDVYSNPELFGKRTGGDIVENKKTYLLINALAKAQGDIKQELKEWIDKKEFDEAVKIEAVKSIYDKLNIGKQTLEKASEFSRKAFESLSKTSVGVEKRVELEKLGRLLLDREK